MDPPPWGGGGRYFDGMIDDLAVWDEALSPEDILLIYNGGVQGTDAVTALVGAVPGDVDGNLSLEYNDLIELEAHWGLDMTAITPDHPTFRDLDDSGRFDLGDFVKLRAAFEIAGLPAPGAAPTPAPEPATMSLLALGGLAVLRRRRK